MTSSKEIDYRFEIKYAVPDVDHYAVRAWIVGHSHGFRQAYADRRVNNIYFDSLDYQCLQVGLAGLADRCKLRLRWYGDTMHPENTVLEQKRKQGALGWKISRACPGRWDLPRMRLSSLVRRLRQFDLGPLETVLSSYNCPVLMNHYQRKYFISGDERVRLTVDSKLAFYDQTCSSVLNVNHAAPGVNVIVVELKASREDEELVERIADDFHFRAIAFSKFSVGLLGLSHTI